MFISMKLNALIYLFITVFILNIYSFKNTVYRSDVNQRRNSIKLKMSDSEELENNPFVPVKSSEKLPWVSNSEPKSARDMANFKYKVPFSEEMYEVIKRAIEILTTRMHSTEPVSFEDAKWFSEVVDIIIEDAHKYGPPPKPVRKEKEISNIKPPAPII